MSKTGHAFIKERMRQEDAIYGGEMSAHHYFRDFAYCDSGMIPWLLIAELISVKKKSLSKLVTERIVSYPVSGELNFTVSNPSALLKSIFEKYAEFSLSTDNTDGLSMEFDKWRFNIRSSNTEPLLRLNIEARANLELLKEKVFEITSVIKGA